MTRTSGNNGLPPLGGNYQRRDPMMDYEEFEAAPGLLCRGPQPASLEPGRYIACVGAAQSFGPYCTHPFPRLLSDALHYPVLNLGIGGAGPRKIHEDERLMRLTNGAKFVVLQVLSGRSESNSRIVSPTGGGLVSLDGEDLERAIRVWRRALKSMRQSEIGALMAETRQNWVSSFRSLMTAVERPVILLWFSRRTPRYVEDYRKVQTLVGGYPQFVNEEMISTLRPLATEHVECVTKRGWPLTVRTMDGKPLKTWRRSLADIVRHQSLRAPVRNRYYPSPEMHEDAAAALTPVCRRLLAADGGTT